MVAGLNHTCALLSTGEVRCWGANNEGQLGRPGVGASSSTPQTVQTLLGTPATLQPLVNVVQLEASGNQTCARTGQGTVFCWGAGVLPSGTATSAVWLSNASEITDITVGDEHVCIRGGDGSVWCRGGNGYGQLGRGYASGAQPGFAEVLSANGSPLRQVASVFGGRYSTCAVLAEGSVVCWGAPYQGRLGTGSPAPNNTVAQPMLNVANATFGATGNTHTCVVRADTAALNCTGSDWYGEIGDGAGVSPDRATPIEVQMTQTTQVGTPPFTWFVTSPVESQGRATLVAGVNHFCAIARALDALGQMQSRVFCWGLNNYGQCGPQRARNSSDGGLPFHENEWSPRQVPLDGLPVALSAGEFFTCALLSNGRVQCWGYNMRGNLGLPNGTANVAPRTIALDAAGSVPLQNVVDIASTVGATCVLRADGEVLCWGDNSYGQLGTNSHTELPTPPNQNHLPAVVSTLSRTIQIGAGGNHFCALRADASVRCWGLAGNSQVGSGANTTINASYLDGGQRLVIRPAPNQPVAQFDVPLPIVATTGIASRVPVALTAGDQFTFVRFASGQLGCWGLRNDGRCGEDVSAGGLNPHPWPLYPGIGDVIALSSGYHSSCAIHRDGRAFCWGDCNLLGTGSTAGCVLSSDGWQSTWSNRVGVRAAPGGTELRGFVAVATGMGTACGALGDGTLRCWGSNAFGMTGTAANPSTTPYLPFATLVTFSTPSPIQ